MTLAKVLEAIPHRPPFLWVDRIVEQEEGRIVTRKRVDPDEPCLRGHYPTFPLLPGVLVLEAIFQTGALLLAARASEELAAGKLPVLVRARDARWKRMVRPGEELEVEVRLVDALGGAFKLSGEARVGAEVAATCEFMVALAAGPAGQVEHAG